MSSTHFPEDPHFWPEPAGVPPSAPHRAHAPGHFRKGLHLCGGGCLRRGGESVSRPSCPFCPSCPWFQMQPRRGCGQAGALTQGSAWRRAPGLSYPAPLGAEGGSRICLDGNLAVGSRMQASTGGFRERRYLHQHPRADCEADGPTELTCARDPGAHGGSGGALPAQAGWSAAPGSPGCQRRAAVPQPLPSRMARYLRHARGMQHRLRQRARLFPGHCACPAGERAECALFLQWAMVPSGSRSTCRVGSGAQCAARSPVGSLRWQLWTGGVQQVMAERSSDPVVRLREVPGTGAISGASAPWQ